MTGVVTPERGVVLIGKYIEKSAQFQKSGATLEMFTSWKAASEGCVRKVFGDESQQARAFSEVASERGIFLPLDKLTGLLKGFIEILETDIELQKEAVPLPVSTQTAPVLGRKVFIVHGHAKDWREAVAKFVRKLGLEAVILDEQVNKGRTIIQKFEEEAEEAGFAIVLMTGDDCGGLRTEKPETYQPRARQNVIFELGYFWGKLGRHRVVALYEEGVEIPSDYKGVLYVPLDDKGDWRDQIEEEMKAAKLPFNP